jgi:CTP synthase
MEAYRAGEISERHRHRYEFNSAFEQRLVEQGLVISGRNPETSLVEMIELPGHPWFLGCQFHPEFKSKPMQPHPLFREFVRACLLFRERDAG